MILRFPPKVRVRRSLDSRPHTDSDGKMSAAMKMLATNFRYIGSNERQRYIAFENFEDSAFVGATGLPMNDRT